MGIRLSLFVLVFTLEWRSTENLIYIFVIFIEFNFLC